MELKLGNRFVKQLQSRIEGYEFEVGVLDPKPHRDPIETPRFQTPSLGEYAGGPVRRASRKTSGQSTGDVLVSNMERLNINLLLRPFQDQSADINKFTKAFLQSAVAQKSMKRVENLLQAIVRNPILRGEYGSNKAHTADAKGFDRHLIDTAQMFKAIRARAKRV